jgi:hypothetical protein
MSIESQQGRPLLGNGSVNTPAAGQWPDGRVSATAVTSRNNKNAVEAVLSTPSDATRTVTLQWYMLHHVTHINRVTVFCAVSPEAI